MLNFNEFYRVTTLNVSHYEMAFFYFGPQILLFLTHLSSTVVLVSIVNIWDAEFWKDRHRVLFTIRNFSCAFQTLFFSFCFFHVHTQSCVAISYYYLYFRAAVCFSMNIYLIILSVAFNFYMRFCFSPFFSWCWLYC